MLEIVWVQKKLVTITSLFECFIVSIRLSQVNPFVTTWNDIKKHWYHIIWGFYHTMKRLVICFKHYCFHYLPIKFLHPICFSYLRIKFQCMSNIEFIALRLYKCWDFLKIECIFIVPIFHIATTLAIIESPSQIYLDIRITNVLLYCWRLDFDYCWKTQFEACIQV